MNRIMLLVAATLVFANVTGQAAGLYKCTDTATGTITYSQTQCAGDVKELPIATGSRIGRQSPLAQWVSAMRSSGVAKTDPATQKEAEECMLSVKAQSSFKDPDSVRIEETPTAIRLNDGKKSIAVYLNAKNSYGGYVGAKRSSCYYNEDGSLWFTYLWPTTW